MKTLEQFIHDNQITETKGNEINMEYIDNEKPVMTKDGRQAVVQDVDLSKIPNVIKGQVKMQNNEMRPYEWEENGTCIKAVDMYGNPKKPDEDDNLVQAI